MSNLCSQNTLCAKENGSVENGGEKLYHCPNPALGLRGRYVSIQRMSAGSIFLMLCELMVYGYNYTIGTRHLYISHLSKNEIICVYDTLVHT